PRSWAERDRPSAGPRLKSRALLFEESRRDRYVLESSERGGVRDRDRFGRPVPIVYAFTRGARSVAVGILDFAQTPELGLRICGSVFGPAPSFGAARGDQAWPARSELRNAYRRDTVPHAMENRSSFADLGLDPAVVRAVDGLGYETPTPIQREAIPPILAGRDVIG